MKSNLIAKNLIEKKHMIQYDLARAVGFKYQSQLSVCLTKDMRMSTYSKIINALNAQIIIRDEDGTEYRVTDFLNIDEDINDN